jgi:hypothetical protein
MMKPNCLNISAFILFFVLLSPSVFAQEFLQEGVIKDKEANERIADAQIINQRTGASVTSSGLGLFQIKASIGDTLLVIKRDYADFTAAVTSTKSMIIYVSRERVLKEVKIYGQTKKTELNDMKREYRNKGSYYQGKPPALSFLFTPLTAIYELFGRTPKNARRFGRYYENEMQQTLIDGFFNETIIQKNTDLKGADLEKFMLDYRPEYDKAKNWIEYDAIKHIKDSYKKYTDTLQKK